ncbi:MAG: hypothetical protein V2J42_02340 [Wenzhouxiangella sp.]|nr:hypothetical protein [Wenzhouxiangella sp.]
MKKSLLELHELHPEHLPALEFGEQAYQRGAQGLINSTPLRWKLLILRAPAVT